MHHVTKVSGLELSSSTTIDVHEARVGEEEVGRSECLRNLHERVFVYEIETNAAEVRGLDQTTWINNLSIVIYILNTSSITTKFQNPCFTHSPTNPLRVLTS